MRALGLWRATMAANWVRSISVDGSTLVRCGFPTRKPADRVLSVFGCTRIPAPIPSCGTPPLRNRSSPPRAIRSRTNDLPRTLAEPRATDHGATCPGLDAYAWDWVSRGWFGQVGCGGRSKMGQSFAQGPVIRSRVSHSLMEQSFTPGSVIHSGISHSLLGQSFIPRRPRAPSSRTVPV